MHAMKERLSPLQETQSTRLNVQSSLSLAEVSLRTAFSSGLRGEVNGGHHSRKNVGAPRPPVQWFIPRPQVILVTLGESRDR